MVTGDSPEESMKTGVLGGTFDPVHRGHIMVAEEARARLGLSGVILMPTGQPWFKQDNPVSAARHRLEMVRLAIAGKPYLKLSSMEVERSGPTYTVDTIAQLKARAGAGDELFFIMGWDNLAQFPHWREPSRLITMCRLVAVPRPGYSLPDLDSLEAEVPGLKENLILLEKPEVAIDSTDIRECIARGSSVDRLIPGAVIKYIEQHQLYPPG